MRNKSDGVAVCAAHPVLGDWVLMAVGVAVLGAGVFGLAGSDVEIVARAAEALASR